MKKTKNIPSLVIVGAGFAGLSVYLTLRKRLGKQIDICIIDKRKEFTYIPALHNCIGDDSYLKSIQFDYHEYYGKDFLCDEVIEITKTSVSTASGKIFHPDYIVIATGSRTNTFGNQNFETHSHMFRFAEDVQTLNKQLPNADTVTVIGGGYTGIEIICTLAQKFPTKQLRIIHSKGRLLEKYSEHVSTTVEQWLQKRGVEILLNQRVQDLGKHNIILQDGSTIHSELNILSSGIAINDDSYRDHLKFQTNYSALEGDHVFLCGDVAEHGLLSTAHNAMIEGRRVGNIVADTIMGVQDKVYSPLENRVILALAMGTRDGMITNGPKGFFVPYVIGFCKRIVERRCMFEFMHKVMLRV